MKSPLAALLIIGVVSCIGCTQTVKPSVTDSEELETIKPMIEYIVPEGIKAAPHFSHVLKSNGQNTIYVSGMTGQSNGKNDPLEEYKIQLQQAYDKIGVALKAVGATPQDVARQRILIVGISPKHAPITRDVMKEFYGDSKPTSTASGTSGLFNPDLVVEVDVTAVLAE